MVVCLSLDDGINEFSVLISLSLSGMSLLAETLVLVSSPLLQDGLIWKAECPVEHIIYLQPFEAALISSLLQMMLSAKSN